MVGSERALSEVDGVRLMVSVKVGRLPPLPETLVRPYNAQDSDSRMTLTATTSHPIDRCVRHCPQWVAQYRAILRKIEYN